MTKYHTSIHILILTLASIFGLLIQSCTSKTGIQSNVPKTGISSSLTNTGTPTTGQTYMKEVIIDHPIYVGFLLIDEPTVESMEELCNYYGLTPEATTDGYTAYRATDGTLLRFKQSDDPTTGVNGNLIEIQTRANQKTLNKILSSLNFTKANKGAAASKVDAYDKGSTLTRSKIRCFVTPGSPRTLTFRSIANNTY